MMRPFISSSGSFKAVTVRSAVTSEDIRSIAVTRSAWAVSSISRLISRCCLTTRLARSSLISLSVMAMSFSLASIFERPAIFSSFSCCLSRMLWISDLSSSISFSWRERRSERFSIWSNLLSRESSRSLKRFSVCFQSLRLLSSSFFDFSARSAASFLAFKIMSDASFFALRTRSSARFFPPFSFFLS